MKATIVPDTDEVHAAHCCVWHGCKYAYAADDNARCPVVAKTAVQLYDCEMCDDDVAEVKRVLRLHTTILRYCYMCRLRKPKIDINTQLCDHGRPHKIVFEVVIRIGGPRGYRIHQRGQIPNRQAAERSARKQTAIIYRHALGRNEDE